MHELSIVMSIIDIAERQASQANASVIDEIELDIGTLSGIEFDALDFAWTEAVRKTILENAVRKINRIEASADCIDCGISFSIQHYYDPCPVCGGHLINITRGKEMRVKSLVVS
jgi:hydrogenase nickel incorporation protein HypA/HybF